MESEPRQDSTEMGREELERIAEQYEQIDDFYLGVDDSQDSVIGNILGRTEAHVLRFAMIYAALDSRALIMVEDLEAALAFWDYCERSVRYIFSDSTGSGHADKILWELRRRKAGMVKTDIRNEVFNRNISVTDLKKALFDLKSAGLASLCLSGCFSKPQYIVLNL